MKTTIGKKAGAFLLSLALLIGLLPGGSVTAAAACAADSHTPGTELHAADWNSQTGGYAYDYYLCTVCGAACDEDGYGAVLVGPDNGCSGGSAVGGKRHVIGDSYGTTCAGTDTAQYYYCKACGHVVDKDGTIVDLTTLNGHTPGSTQYPADYAPCTGGCKTGYYRCTVCGLPCDANGDGSVYTPAGPQPHPHTPGSVLQPANWDSKNGGYIRSYYTCTVCGTPCDANGHAALYVGPGNNCPMGHTPGSQKSAPNYTPCCGGIQEEWYECDVCGAPCDADGNTLKVFPPVSSHNPGSEKHESNYTACGGGFQSDWYECEICGQPVDENGETMEWSEPTSGHVLGEKREADYTPCNGGFQSDWYECEICHQPLDENGETMEWFEPTSDHILGEKHEADYTPCNGGFRSDWYECEVCHQPIDENGEFMEWSEPTADHVLGEKHEADYTPCNGGFQSDWYECEVCHQTFDENGEFAEYTEGTGVHQLVEVPEKAPTYTEDGHTAYWECEICHAAFKDQAGTQPIEDEAEIRIPKLDVPASDNEPAAPSKTLETVVSAGLDKVPESVSGQYPTTDAVYQALAAASLAADPSLDKDAARTVLLDVTLQIKNANGAVTKVTERNFPAEGVEVLLPYPEGTDETFTFVVAHMITTGSRAGEIEILPNSPEKDGIRVRFYSLSPVTITYAAPSAPPAADGTEESPEEDITIPTAPKTGGPLLGWTVVLSAGGIALLCLAEKKRKNR